MFPRVKGVRHAGEYRLELSFTDGTTSEIDFKGRIAGRGGVFRPLQDIAFFKQVMVDPEAGTIVWPNGVDFCGCPVQPRHRKTDSNSGAGLILASVTRSRASLK